MMEIATPEPTPAMLAELNDQLGGLLKILAKDTLRITATAKLEGRTLRRGEIQGGKVAARADRPK